MKGETSVPYFCACRDHQFGRRRTFDMAVQFRFQRHPLIPVVPVPSAERGRTPRRCDNSARIFRSAMVRPELRRFTIMSEQRTTAAGGMETSYRLPRVSAKAKSSRWSTRSSTASPTATT